MTPRNRRTLVLAAVLFPLAGLFAYAALRSGPLAPIPVVAAVVENHSIAPALFGIGTVEARYTYRIGPTVAGRVARVDVHVGDGVKAGDLLGEMDPVDFDARIDAQKAALKRAQANVAAARAQVQDITATIGYARNQTRRYDQLLQARVVGQERAEAKQQEYEVAQARLLVAKANVQAAVDERVRSQAEVEGLIRQRANLRLVAPVDGLVTARQADPGTTVVAGQAVVELIDPSSLWVNVRFDQLQAAGLRPDLPARIVLRSLAGQAVDGTVLRVEPTADAVTEEILAKVVFNALADPLPPVGELAEVTVSLAALPPLPVVANAGIQRIDGRLGVWVVEAEKLRFAPVRLGAADLEGRVQVLEGLEPGQRVVVYSPRSLDGRSRITLVDHLPGRRP